MHGPSPETLHPLRGEPHTVFLKAVVTRPNIIVGDYSYYHDPEGAAAFEERCVRYHYDFIGDRLVIGRFCALATGIQFIMNGANHALSGFSTYPFNIFEAGWQVGFDPKAFEQGLRGDTVVGNDVWLGREATILPGVTIGDGAVVGAKAVVAADVPPFAVVVGNPARVVRHRFPADVVTRLLEVSWWHWPAEKITRHLDAIRGADLDRLQQAAEAT